MTMQNEILRSFRLYVTHVDGEAHFLKISGQHDQQSSLMVESLFESARENLEKGIGAVHPGAIHEGIICAAKYKDGTYYRAKIINTGSLATGLVGVHFIDFGNKDIISLSTIRFLENYDPMFLKLPGQATDYYLSRIMSASGRWDEPSLLKLQSLICYSEYPSIIDAQPLKTAPIISMQFKGNDLSTHLVSNRIGVHIPVAKQEVLLQQLTSENQQVTSWQPTFLNESPSYLEHVPFLVNQNFPSNPAAAMRMQQNMTLPFNGSIPPPSLISQRLLANKVARNPGSLRAPSRQPQHATSAVPLMTSPPPATTPSLTKPTSPKKSTTYKSRLLEVNSQHKVFVSYAEEGPELFAVQLVTDAKKLQDMMDDINRRPHSSLKEPPMIGTVCLGRMSGDRIICRAIVMNLSGSQCKLFFVDFGDTEMVSYYDIFDIPEEFVKPNVFAMRFCLSGVKRLEKGPYLNESFKQLVNGKVLNLKVVNPEGPPLIQYGELYLDNKNVLELLLANMKDKLQFKLMDMLPPATRQSVLVSYVDSCIKFFIQLSDKIDELNAVMDAVRVHCENSLSPGDLPVGAACCARFPDDGNWYRARVINVTNGRITVTYVDYGNEQEVDVSDLRTITPDLVELPAVALKCALKGFEGKPVESKTSNQLEMLALEKTLMATIVSMLSNDTMLVSLVDESVSPPLDIAKKMMQLSQPRSNIEAKVTTPIRKEAPESFSSPEEGLEDKRGFRREKSFKDDRRAPRDNDDFGQRGSSFRGRDGKDSFERTAPGRHSEKFRRPDDRPFNKGSDRRGGGKPWENREDGEEEPRATRHDRDKRKPRSELYEKPASRVGWKSKEVGAASRPPPTLAADLGTKPHSVQDRLKRDRFNNSKKDEWNESSNDTNSYSRPARDNRPERRDNWENRDNNRGDRREGGGDRKDGFQRREFRDNREQRGDRPKSNFSPRDRAERSFSSDHSDKSGRTSGYKGKPRGGDVQPRTLPNPAPEDAQFLEPAVTCGEQQEVAVTWLASPKSFHLQVLAQQPAFLKMMHAIPELYRGVRPLPTPPSVGAAVLARYPSDGVLYRARVEVIQPVGQLIVRYVDFGNRQLVSTRDVWPLDNSLLELPAMAVHCCLSGVKPAEGEWRAGPELDLCFNAPRYQAVFHGPSGGSEGEGPLRVSLWSNGASVADALISKGLAAPDDAADGTEAVTLKDEAVDLSIIVGQQILCKVTHVVSFEKLYAQLDLDKAALVESAIAEYDTTKLTPLSPESLADGVHCTVKHSDRVYRAILSDTSDTNNITAVLPDYGETITTTIDNLMILPTELTVYYYQSLECKLNNYTAESEKLMTLEELKQKLTGNKFIVYINDVEEISFIGTFYDCVTGKKVEIFSPDEGAYGEVEPFCMRAVYNYNYGNAYVSHAESLNEVYLQRASDGDRIALLLDELYKFYEEGEPQALDTLEVDKMCVAKSSDGNWYRATILSLEENEVKVQFSDYGNSETVAKDALKALDSKFLEPCAMAIVVGLGLVALKEGAVEKFTELTSEKEVQVTLAFGDDGWLANLHLDGVDLALQLVNEGFAAPRGPAAVEEEVVAESSEVPAAEPVAAPPDCVQAYISHIDSPGHFWLQMADKVDQIEEIQAELQASAAGYPDVENADTNTLCVAKYSGDDQWYRAEVLDADADITTVRFLDYGNTDVLDTQPGQLKAMPEHLREIERLAVKASVNAIPTGTGQWSEPASDCFTQLVGDLANPVAARVILKDVTTYVDIYVGGRNLTDELVSAGHAARSEAPAGGGALPNCFASHVNSPSEFWVQLEAATPDLQEIEAAMEKAEDFPELTEREEGVICAALYPEDGLWYRAQLLAAGSGGTEVLFMDYGNASLAGALRRLPAALVTRAALARKCALQRPPHLATWSRTAEQRFNDLAAEGATVFNVQFIAAGDISIVELFYEGKSVTEELVALCEEQVSGEPANEQALVEQAKTEEPKVEQPPVEQPTVEQPAVEQPTVEQPTVEQPTVEQPTVEQPVVEQPTVEQPVIEQTIQLTVEQPTVEQPVVEQPTVEQPTVEQPTVEQPTVEQPTVEQPTVEQPTVEQPVIEQTIVEQPTVEQPTVEQPIVEQPQIEPLTSERPTPIGQDLFSSGKICYVNSSDEFYVQLDSEISEMDKVIEHLGAAEEFEPVAEFKVGSLCAAFWSEDEQWYRAKILEFCDAGYHVLFIDYGNKAKCEDLRSLPEDISAIDRLAKCCRLAGPGEDKVLSEAVKAKLEELMAEDTTFQIEFLDSSKEPALVKLFYDGRDVISTVQIEATPAEREKKSPEVTQVIEEANVSCEDVEFTPENTQSSSPIPKELETTKEESNNTLDGSPMKIKSEESAVPVEHIKSSEESTDAGVEKKESEKEDEAVELDISNSDLNESGDSSHTVIENKNFEENQDLAEQTPLKNTSVETDTSTETVTNDSRESGDSQASCELNNTPVTEQESPDKKPE